MSTGNLNLDILLSEILESNDFSPSILSEIRKYFPNVSEDDAKKIALLCSEAYKNSINLSVSLVATVPTSFSIKAFPTSTTVEKLLQEANKSICMTGYSLSDYFAPMIDTVIEKAKRGVYVRFFVNDIDEKPEYNKLLRYRSPFLKIYNFKNKEDSMAALHAKVIVVDGIQTLITSANLSYHGQEGNIELGTLVKDKNYAKQVENLFSQLINNRVFKEIRA